MNKKINIITLGCSKNVVDSEILSTYISKNGYTIVFDGKIEDTQIAIVNTCGFIQDAKQESIDTILQLAKAKDQNTIEKLFVMGCLSQLYKKELKEEIPQIDEIFGVAELPNILDKLNLHQKDKLNGERLTSTPKHYAFLKIAEGCNRKCSFCAIPNIRGNYQSRNIESLVEEAKYLANQGIKELIIISQDSAYYGYDNYKKFALVELLKELVKIDNLEWIRIQYLYPTKDLYELIDFTSENTKICKYFDIPFQHINDDILKSMRRGHTKQDILDIINYIRKKIPNAAIRSTFIVGFPDETQQNFDELLTFLSQTKLDRVGFFTYSQEENTYAASLKDNVSLRQKKYRFKTAMELQSTISYEKNQKKINTIEHILIDRIEGDFFVGRSQHDSPEVDNEFLIAKSNNLKIGEFYDVEIYDATEFDLYAKKI